MKLIYIAVLLLVSNAIPIAAFDVKLFGMRFGAGIEIEVDASSEACRQIVTSPDSKPKPGPKSNPKPNRPKTAAVLVKSTETIKFVSKDKDEDVKPKPAKTEKPEYLLKAEKAVKVRRPYKRDWHTLTADSIGAAGITYGARKQNWFLGSGGAIVLIYSLIAERNTNSPLDQIVSVASGVGLGYLPKISSDEDDTKVNNPNSTPLPPPPAP